MSHFSTGEDAVLAIPIEDGQYRIHSVGAVPANAWPDTENGLLTGEDTWLAVLSAQAYGTAQVRVLVAQEDPGPDDGDWEMVVERSLATPSDAIGISRLYGTSPLHTIAAPLPLYDIRLHCTGRLRARQEPDGVETHLLQLWPADSMHAERLVIGPDEYGRMYLDN